MGRMNKLLLSLLFVFCYNHCADESSKTISTRSYGSPGKPQSFGWLDNNFVGIAKPKGELLVWHKLNGQVSAEETQKSYLPLDNAKTLHKTGKQNNTYRLSYQKKKNQSQDVISIKETINNKTITIGEILFKTEFKLGKHKPSWNNNGETLAIPLVHENGKEFAICIAQLQPKTLVQFCYLAIKKAPLEKGDAQTWQWMQQLSFIKELEKNSQ